MSFPRYERYKDSGVEWLGEVPEHWETFTVKRIAEKIGSGKTPLGGSEVYVSEGVLFLRSQNVYDDGLRLDDAVYIAPEVDEAMASTRVRSGDILLNVTGASIGRTCIVPEPFVSANVNQHVCIVRISEPDIREFVAIAMKSDVIQMQIDLAQNGAAREGLNFQQIGDLVFGMTQVTGERDKIVTFLHRETAKIDGLIEEQRRLIELLKEKRQAVISHAVTKGLNPHAPMKDSDIEWVDHTPEHWLTMSLRWLISAHLVNGIFKKRADFGFGTLLVNVFDIYCKDFKVKFGQLDRVSCNANEIEAYRVLEGDLFFVRSSLKAEGIAAVALAEHHTEPAVFECHLIRARPKKVLFNPRYGSYLLNSSIYRSKTLSLAKITTMTTLDQESLLSIALPIPPVEEQQKIAAFLDEETSSLDELISLADAATALLQERRIALISAAVTGKIDVRNYIPKEAA